MSSALIRWSRWLFAAAGIYGIAVLAPLYFLESQIAAGSQPFAHPEYYYGFIGTALASQAMFFMIASDPMRFWPAMILPCWRSSPLRFPSSISAWPGD